MAYISQQIIDDIRDKADIVEIIQSYIPLKRAGRNFKALCPFHHEKTPSFMVSPDKQIFHCFGCGVGGNIFNFVMKHENLNFKEAVEVVAGKIGFYIPEEKFERKESSLIKKLFSVNELAANFYHGALLNSPQAEIARRYLKKRAVVEKTIKEFRLGFSFSGWGDFVAYAKKKGYSEQLLEKVGLAIKGKQGTYYDRFRNKLMFPITNNQGKVLGFGSRTLDEKEEGPKYVNSPETEIYTKRKTLYGLNLAKSHIVKNGIAIITEGYFDVIIPYQAGIRNIVGCLGTSFTPEQAHILKRYAKDVILLFDADKAGESATLRGLDILIEEGLMVKIGCLPPDYDADKLVKQKGKEALNEIIQGSKDLFEYKLDLLKAKYPLKIIENKPKITSEILPTIKKIENSVLKSAYIKRLAQEIEISEQALLDELRKIKQAKYDYETQKEAASMKLNIPPAERMLLRLMLEDVSVINEIKESLEIYDFEHPLIQKIISLLFELGFNEGQLVSSAIMDRIGDEGAQRLISEVLTDTTEIIDRGKSIKDCINSIKKKKLKTKLNQLESQIRYVESVKDEPKRDYLTKEFQRVLKEYSRLSNVR